MTDKTEPDAKVPPLETTPPTPALTVMVYSVIGINLKFATNTILELTVSVFCVAVSSLPLQPTNS